MDSIYAFLKEKLKDVEKLAVLGAGSVLRADDAAGMCIVEDLQAAFEPNQYPKLLLCAGETAPENFSGKIRSFSPTHLLVVDAADVGQAPGCIVEIRPEQVGGLTFCSHMLPLRVMIDYLVEETGTDVTLLGIQYKSIEFDGEMTVEIQAAVDEVCDAIARIVQEHWGIR